MAYLVAALCALLWTYFAAPLVTRLFGISMPVAWRKRWDALQQLDLVRFILSYGILTFGMSGFVFSVMEILADWRFSSELWNSGLIPEPLNSGRSMLLIFATWMCAGLAIGWLTGKSRNTSRSS